MHIAKQALERFNLNAVWWMVSPGNPLKVKDPIGDLDARVAATQAFIDHPRMVATGIEAELNTRYTYDTIVELKRLFPATRFIWIAGMDNAAAFERWDRWQELPKLIPFAFFDRPPALSKIKGKKLREMKGIPQYTRTTHHTLEPAETGVYWMMTGRAINLSSTMLRAARKKAEPKP